MTNVNLYCKSCKYTARRPLMNETASRGVRETSSERALCPNGHGPLARVDGLKQERWAIWSKFAGFRNQLVDIFRYPKIK